ncbi:CsbD family protein [Kitasatospora sp. McL0602]|uniref:CsbD family protein n=1 Tax=Kitasatospora sp. McL0602 TaxID=3439530 RepID=UPI003F8BB8C8
MSETSDKMQHKAQEVVGAAKEKVGDATGNDRLKAEGQGDQAESKVKQAVDETKDKAQEGVEKIKGMFDR